MRTVVFFLACVVTLPACGGGGSGGGAAPDRDGVVATGIVVPKTDPAFQPATVEQARAMCDAAPSDWDVVEHPREADYYGFRWVMCHPALVIDMPPPVTCTGNESMDGCGLPTIDGYPYSTSAFYLQVPDGGKTMFASFPVGSSHQTGSAFGLVEEGRGGLVHWLRLPVEPSSVAAVGASEVIYVRLKNGPAAPRL
jgi:hypothetical protein